jgi:pimeloyl-ACP methyl ester carboxylesterase
MKVKFMKSQHLCLFTPLVVIILLSACTPNSPSPSPTKPWVEEEVTFNFGPNELYGILTLPTSEGPYPAVAIISGSVNPSTGARGGVSALYHVDHARELVLNGFAVLRYDPPGVGRSTGEREFESLESRTDEAVAALNFLQTLPDVQPDRVGFWGESQGPWVIAKVAAAFPQDVAFIISVSGSGVSVVEEQIYNIEAHSRDVGMSEDDINKAILFGRLLIDWQLSEPIYREVNEEEATFLKEGPWTSFMTLVYESGETNPAEGLQIGIDILKSIQDKPWAKFLYLKEVYIPQLESIPPDQVEAVKAIAGQTLLNDPKDFLTRVQCPVLAFFGEDDLLQPSEISAKLYEQYLSDAGNDDFVIVVIPGVGHGISPSTPAYREALSDWSEQLFSQ